VNRKKDIRNASTPTRRLFSGSIYALTSGLAIAVGVSHPISAQEVVATPDETITVGVGETITETANNAITVSTGVNGVTINNSGTISSANAFGIQTEWND